MAGAAAATAAAAAAGKWEDIKLSYVLTAPVEGLGFYPGPAGPQNVLSIGAIWDRGNSPFDRAGCIANDIVLQINSVDVNGSFVSDAQKLYAVCRARTPAPAGAGAGAAPVRFEVLVRRNVALEDANRKQTYGELGVNTELGTPLSRDCCLCAARLIEDDGQWRWHCVDCPYTFTDLCDTCYRTRYVRDPPQTTALAIRSAHVKRAADHPVAKMARDPACPPLHDMVTHTVVRESAGPVSLRLQVLGARPAVTLNNALRAYAPRPLFGSIVNRSADAKSGAQRSERAYAFISYAETQRRVVRLACGFRHATTQAGALPPLQLRDTGGAVGDGGAGDVKSASSSACAPGSCLTVGICGANSLDWLLADFSCAYNNCMTVGLHSNWLAPDLHYVLHDAECSVVCCDEELAPMFVAAKYQHTPTPTASASASADAVAVTDALPALKLLVLMRSDKYTTHTTADAYIRSLMPAGALTAPNITPLRVALVSDLLDATAHTHHHSDAVAAAKRTAAGDTKLDAAALAAAISAAPTPAAALAIEANARPYADRLRDGYECSTVSGINLFYPTQAVQETGFPVLNWSDARDRAADAGKYVEVKCKRSVPPVAGRHSAVCDEWSMPYYLPYRFEAIRKRVWGPVGYCNSCYNSATDVPELTAHRQRMAVASADLAKQNRDRLYALVYSSGSTGRPKGCMMVDSGWNDSVAGSATTRWLSPNAVLSYSALGHAMDRMMIWQTLCNGGRVGFVTPHYTMPQLYADCQLLRPVLFVAMPDFWNGLFTEYGNRLVAALSAVPKSTPHAQIVALQQRVLSDVRQLLGGCIRATGTGGARVSHAVLQFMAQCFESKPTNAYGTTEASGISSNGLLNPGVKLELASCPEVKYTTDDLPYPRGEIKVKTNGMIAGYWKKPKETAAAFVNGWSLTGDIGEREPGGPYLRIVDRKQNFVELYVNHESVWLTPEPLQALYSAQNVAASVYLHGERHAQYLCAVVVPRRDWLAQWTREHGLEKASALTLADNALLKRDILLHFAAVGKAAKLKEYEIPTAVVLELSLQWTAANQLATAHGKLVRPKLFERYRLAIDMEIGKCVQADAPLHSAAEGASADTKAGGLDADSKRTALPSAALDEGTDPQQLEGATPGAGVTLVERDSHPKPPVFVRSKSMADPQAPATAREWSAIATDLLNVAARTLNAHRPTDQCWDVSNAPPGVFEGSFMTLCGGDTLAAQQFHHALCAYISASTALHTLLPPFEFVAYQPLTVLVDTIEFASVQRFITGWSDVTTDDTAKMLDYDTFLIQIEEKRAADEAKAKAAAASATATVAATPSAPPKAEAGDVLLTGANTFVGAHVLAELLRATAPALSAAPARASAALSSGDAKAAPPAVAAVANVALAPGGVIYVLVSAADVDALLPAKSSTPTPTPTEGKAAVATAGTVVDGDAWARALLSRWSQADAPYAGRVRVVVGDVTAPRFGLPADAYGALVAATRAVYHMHERVDLVARYADLRADNVLAVVRAVEFARASAPTAAAATAAPKALFHLSSLSVHSGLGPVKYATGAPEYDAFKHHMKHTPEALSVAEDARTANVLSAPGYVQSKYVAERLLLRTVRKDRTLSVAVYRAGHVWFHTGTGAADPTSFLSRVTLGVQQLGVYPEPIPRTDDGDKHTCMYVNACSVDYLSRVIAATSLTSGTVKARPWVLHAVQRSVDLRLHDLVFGAAIKARPVPTQQWLDAVYGALTGSGSSSGTGAVVAGGYGGGGDSANALFGVWQYLLQCGGWPDWGVFDDRATRAVLPPHLRFSL